MSVNYKQIPSPAYVLEEALLRRNLEWIDEVQQITGVDVILAFKGFAMWSIFALIREYLPGATASSLHEARLCYEEMGVRAHTYAPAYIPEEMEELLGYSSHLTFNSLSQIDFYKTIIEETGNVSFGLRVNPEYASVETDLYNPCAPGSRLGVLAEQLGGHLPKGIKGLHFHTLCESTSYDLEKTLEAFESKFSCYFKDLEWVNFGGGHLMTQKDYDRRHLTEVLKQFKAKYPHLKVILEPGSAIAWETGVLVSTVLDIVENKGIKTAMLDISFTAHQPDTLEMPYRPNIVGAGAITKNTHNYRLGGISCLSGDYVEEYGFEQALNIGDKVVFLDMMHYTMVKTSTFNGVKHPSIGIWREIGDFDLIRRFGYEDFKHKLS